MRSHKVVLAQYTRNQFERDLTRVRIPPAAPRRSKLLLVPTFFVKPRARAVWRPLRTAHVRQGEAREFDGRHPCCSGKEI